MERCFFSFSPPPPPTPLLEMGFGRRVGGGGLGAAGLGADGGDRSWPLFTVRILSLNKSCSKGSGSLCLEASFFPLCDLEIAADEIALQLAGDMCTEYSIFSLLTYLSVCSFALLCYPYVTLLYGRVSNCWYFLLNPSCRGFQQISMCFRTSEMFSYFKMSAGGNWIRLGLITAFCDQKFNVSHSNSCLLLFLAFF